jgi:RNA polymerase sigma-70 factor (ECF subfamily)
MRDAVPIDGRISLLTISAVPPRAGTGEPAVLVRAAQTGSRDAFGLLYQRFAGYVYAILVARLSPDAAADLVQDVFVQALERIGSLRDPAAFPGWIAAIARNRGVDALKRQPKMETIDDRHAAASPSPEARIDAARALAAIRRLPDAYRETLVLRFVQGLTGPEIADITGLTPDSVRVNLHRGFKLLRAELGLAP